VKGLYGKSPAPMSEEVKKKIIGDEEVFTGRPADLIPPEFSKLKEEIGDLAHSDEEVLTYGMFPQIAKTYLEGKYAPAKEEVKVQTINIVF
ncbi:MAG: oxaloacetate decarboxylase subunit alpha, partial [Cetobacterium sp.]